ncbi:MAG: sensor histidine kinase [Solirubrobacteraceae bacterium]
MALRRRLALVAAAAVGIAILIAASVCYLVVRSQLRGQVDDALRAQVTAVRHGDVHALDQPLPGIPPSAGGPAQYVQIVAADGNIRQGEIALPVDARTRALARGGSGTYLADLHIGHSHLRQLAFGVSVRLGSGLVEPAAVQLARPLNGVDHILSELRLILALLCAGGIALAAALGRLAARRVLAPLAEVTQAAQHIGETDDLSRRIAVRADDEVGQLATRFNAMLERLQRSRAALDESVHAQRQLVADASHELRTPVTSLRTNIEVLLAGGELSSEDRDRLLADVVEQSEELSALVGDLIELARGEDPSGSPEESRLDGIVAESITRARRNSPGVQFEAVLEPVLIDGIPERLGRAVNNLLDNAARHSPPGGAVEVVVDAGGVRVRDHGPGVAPEDLPCVFDRFFRGANSRGRQGSGLGLAIVRQVAEQHGGSATVANATGGGAIFSLRLPGSASESSSLPEWDSSTPSEDPRLPSGLPAR